ncbi:MAG: hypothetical protein NTX87_00365 [Planctomycetota bacterium]|nr:hypothetical protein [Planctomycetota bacterium]
MTREAETADVLEVLLAGYLAEHCRGRQRARTQARIARDLRGLALDVTPRDVQDAVARLRLAGCSVGTADAGVFLCADRRDWRVAYRNLYGRLRTQARGARAFRETFRRAVGGQAVFDFAEAAARLEAIESAPLFAQVEVHTRGSQPGCAERGRRDEAGRSARPAWPLAASTGGRRTEAAHAQKEIGARCPTTERMHV